MDEDKNNGADLGGDTGEEFEASDTEGSANA